MANPGNARGAAVVPRELTPELFKKLFREPHEAEVYCAYCGWILPKRFITFDGKRYHDVVRDEFSETPSDRSVTCFELSDHGRLTIISDRDDHSFYSLF
jgi:hypothetical protein